MKEVGQLLAKYIGDTPNHLGMGRRFSTILAALIELKAKLTGSRPIISRSMAHEVVRRYGYYDSTSTNQAFGIVPRQAEDVITDCIRWLLHVGKIKPSIANQLGEKLSPAPEWGNIS